MDSPVIVDTASKFGRGIDLDRSFPGFPFDDDDDDDFGRRSDIRAHLDDLAARHPEFADHLLGPPWGDIPFRGSTHNQRRGSGNGGGGSSYQSYPDEDARSQASGSSAASAASGASGVSSHGEPDAAHEDQQDRGQSQRETKRTPIPQYGLRNTVDIGQHHRHNMENPEKESRGQRSMSAPPENRQQTSAHQASQEQDKTPQQGQRFVSRVDITPQHNQQSTQQQSTKQQQPQSPPQQQPQSNVRHIPIFVEGRDEPVIPKNIDAPFQRQQSPPQFHAPPPHFQKSSPFNQRFGTRQWPPHFQDSFYQPHPTFDHSPTRRAQQTYQQPRQQQQYAERQRAEQPQRHQFETPQSQEHQSRQRPQRHQQQEEKPPQQQQQQPQQQQPQQEAPKPPPKPTLPKDPLERVALVQKEVDSLAEQVKLYTGNSRKEKQYIFLDEMLTRELIKLDDIETEGRENVRQARKNAIRTIQETISLLESKAPLPGQEKAQNASQDMQVDQSEDDKEQKDGTSNEAMEVEQNTEQNAQANEAIPLPPGPSSPTKQASENDETAAPLGQEEQQSAATMAQAAKQEQEENQSAQSQEQQQQPGQQQQDATPADTSSNENTNSGNEAATQPDTSTPMEVQEKVESVVEEKKDENQNVPHEIKQQDNGDQKKPVVVEERKATLENKEMAKTDKGSNKPVQSPKTIKKAKKQAVPISKEAIPLPPPQSTETSAK